MVIVASDLHKWDFDEPITNLHSLNQFISISLSGKSDKNSVSTRFGTITVLRFCVIQCIGTASNSNESN